MSPARSGALFMLYFCGFGRCLDARASFCWRSYSGLVPPEIPWSTVDEAILVSLETGRRLRRTIIRLYHKTTMVIGSYQSNQTKSESALDRERRVEHRTEYEDRRTRKRKFLAHRGSRPLFCMTFIPKNAVDRPALCELRFLVLLTMYVCSSRLYPVRGPCVVGVVDRAKWMLWR